MGEFDSLLFLLPLFTMGVGGEAVCVPAGESCANYGNQCDGLGDYTGTRNTTVSGRTCQRWDSQTPHSHGYTSFPENYCSTDPGEPGPWCYTTDQHKRWDYCFNNCHPDCDCGTYPPHPTSAVHIASPSYPAGYGPYCKCSWTFHTEPGNILLITFDDFDGVLDGTQLEILDRGADYMIKRCFGDRTLANECYEYTPAAPLVTTQSIEIRFYVEGTNSADGFNLTVYTAPDYNPCIETFFMRDHPITITSPSFPSDYPGYQSCDWIFQSAQGCQLQIDFSSFATESGWDFLYIYDGLHSTDQLIQKCDGSSCSSTLTTGSSLRLAFFSDKDANDAGFSATVTKINSMGVGGEAVCVPAGETCANYGNQCNGLGDYSGTRNTTVSGRTCQRWDSQTPHSHGYTSFPENYCSTDPSEPGPWCYTTNPHMRWDYCFNNCDPDCDCGTYPTHPTSAVQIVSPSYPTGFGPYCKCSWTFHADPGNLFLVTFDDFDGLWDGSQLEILDKGSNFLITRCFGDRSQANKCYLYTPAAPLVTTQSIEIRFYVKGTNSADGFNLTVSPAPEYTPCAETVFLRDDPITITSPNFPSNYPDVHSCEWFFQSGQGCQLQIDFSSFATESSWDFLYIYDGLHSTDELMQKCDGTSCSSSSSTGSSLRLSFFSDRDGNDAGFSATVTKINSCAEMMGKEMSLSNHSLVLQTLPDLDAYCCSLACLNTTLCQSFQSHRDNGDCLLINSHPTVNPWDFQGPYDNVHRLYGLGY